MPNIEELAVAALHAWNGVEGGHFEWPKYFPEGSRAAWRRVVAAITEQNAAANPGRSLTELPSLHQPDRLQGEDASQDKREGRISPAAPDLTINLLPADFEKFMHIAMDPDEKNNPLLDLMCGYTVICQWDNS